MKILRLIFIILAALCHCECVFVSSSFWAPLFNPKILNYRVDVPFSPDAGKNAREDFAKKYGEKGENLIANLGNGKGPNDENQGNQDNGPIKFYYTYPGASKNNKYEYR